MSSNLGGTYHNGLRHCIEKGIKKAGYFGTKKEAQSALKEIEKKCRKRSGDRLWIR